MNTIESLLSLLAPHRCLGCGKKGYVMCETCQSVTLARSPSRCYRCHKATMQHQTCAACRRITGLQHVWVSSQYDGLAKEVLELMKFHRASAASSDIARTMADILPVLPPCTIVTYVPTAHARIRQRGFDQSRLVARELAKRKGLEFQPLFNRVSSTRQLGASREQRFTQAKSSFALKNTTLKGLSLLIVDDVTTSGATIESLATLAKQAGAKNVDATVFAQAID